MKTITDEAIRCLKCKVPICAKNCPVSTPVPHVTQLFLDGKLQEAGRILFDNNPLSALTSIICPHEKNCCGHCVLGIKSEPVEFFKLEQYISGLYLENYTPQKPVLRGIRAAVIGAGPAGITMSILLAREGIEVTLFEAENDIGGVLRYGIPAFRLSKDLLKHYRRILDALGVHIRCNFRFGTGFNEDDLFLDGYKIVYSAYGTGRPMRLGLLGETLGNVYFAINFLKSPQNFRLGKRVAVIGAGNVAMDAARTAIRLGSSEVTVINRADKEDMTASRDEIELAKAEGAQFIHLRQAVRIKETSVSCIKVNKLTDENGSVTFEEDFSDLIELPVDSVILAIGQGPGAELSYGSGIDLTGRGLIRVDEKFETSIRNVFAGGDVVTGPSTVVQAVSSSIKASKYILERLSGEEKHNDDYL